MAEERAESSVATSSSTQQSWWDLHHANSLSSWTSSSPWNQQNHNSNSSCDEDVSISTSFTNASNHSGLTVESSRRLVESAASSNELMGEHASDNNLWNHVLLDAGSNGDLHHNQDVGENLLDPLSCKSMSPGIFESPCNYLKKMGSNWEFTNSSSLNNFEKQLSGFSEGLIESERLTKLSNLVSNWSIAPPDPDVNAQFDPQTCNISLSSSMNQYTQPGLCQMKPTFSDSTSCGMGGLTSTLGLLSCYGHDLKVENEHHHTEAPTELFRRSFSSNGIGYHIGSKYYYGMPAPCTSPRTSFADSLTFTSRLTKPLIQTSKPCFKPQNLSDYKKQGPQNASLTRVNGRIQGITNEGKKKRAEETSDAVLKKPKHESSTVSSLKAPKVKLGERITALQQIVSPFGKTDTASVLLEAIGYIKFLQEQVQLLSNPYMKTNPHKDPWGALDRKDKGEMKLDLRSRGLCLVPISCTPQVYRDNTGSDYWSPTYRGFLYR